MASPSNYLPLAAIFDFQNGCLMDVWVGVQGHVARHMSSRGHGPMHLYRGPRSKPGSLRTLEPGIQSPGSKRLIDVLLQGHVQVDMSTTMHIRYLAQ